MKSLADNLPPEFAAFVHPDWRKNEADYWAVREQLLEQYRDQWLGFAGGALIASGNSAADVVPTARKAARHAFVTRVGREGETTSGRAERISMRSIADFLPAEIATQLHPDLLKNEEEYWWVRDHLLEQYQGKWIAFADGAVITSGKVPVKVGHEARRTGKHAHVTCVGHEFGAERIRRVSFPYDGNYSSHPMPRMNVEFRTSTGIAGMMLLDVIPDTGADASSLPWADCLALQLNPAHGQLGVMAGVSGYKGTVVFDIWAFLDTHEYTCHLHVDPSGTERILGRDVLNQLEILFRGPANEVVVNP
jgi:hypothetical protein